MAPRDPIVDFYSGGRDFEGRLLADILGWDDERLEAVHDYIQWLFPTREASGVNLRAPLVTDATIGAFVADEALRSRLAAAFARMLLFYGLQRRGEVLSIDAARFSSRALVWLHPGNHNHLRLTRMMKSLALLGLDHEARALQRCLLEEVCNGPGRQRVSPVTIEFWRHAI